MKVLSVNFSIATSTGFGVADRLFQLNRFFSQKGIECTVLNLRLGQSDTPEKELSDLGVKVITFPCLLKRYYIPLVSYKKLKRIVSDCDIVILMNHWTILNALIYWMARKLNKPYLFCPAGALPAFGRSKLLKKIYSLVVGNSMMRNANCCVASTAPEMDVFKSYGVPFEKIVLIPNGVNVSEYQPQTEIKSSLVKNIVLSSPQYILFMGRLNYIKGPDLLLQAFIKIHEQFPEHHLIFAGPDKGMQAQLTEQTIASGLSNKIHFLGFLSGDDRLAIYQNAKLLVVPSRREALSMVVLEAGLMGIPALMTDQCGFSEIEDVRGGHVVPATVLGLAEGLNRLLTSGKDNLEKMGNNLQQHVIANYSWDIQITKFIQLSSQILGSVYNSLGVSRNL